jgi:tetratricopeptide (TPR) repeat protein
MRPRTAHTCHIFTLIALCTLLAYGRIAASEHPDVWTEVRSPHFIVVGDAGDKKERHIAQQFEQLRAAFHSSFPAFRVDLGQPILIVAVKNELEMKDWLPQDWEAKGHFHPSGVYFSTPERDFVVFRMEPAGEDPYHTLCHEYAHALLHLNFRTLPPWLNEGLAGFFGNCSVNEKEVRVGQVNGNYLRTLAETQLLPLSELFRAEQDSVYYTEENEASLFYAESWAFVHYLIRDPQANAEHLLPRFLAAWQESGDQVEAAKKTFGDTQRLDSLLANYARQPNHSVTQVPVVLESAADSFPGRNLSPAEVLILRGDFYLRREQPELGREILSQALHMEPRLGAAHEALGLYYFQQKNYAAAITESQEAIRLHGSGFLAYFLYGAALLENHSFSQQNLQSAQDSLEEAIRRNPTYAPAHFRLSLLYSQEKTRQREAIAAAQRATELEPGSTFYLLNLGDQLVNNFRDSDARSLVENVLKTARTPVEQRLAQEILNKIREHELQRKASSQ